MYTDCVNSEGTFKSQILEKLKYKPGSGIHEQSDDRARTIQHESQEIIDNFKLYDSMEYSLFYIGHKSFMYYLCSQSLHMLCQHIQTTNDYHNLAGNSTRNKPMISTVIPDIEMFLYVTQLCVDVIAYGLIIIPDLELESCRRLNHHLKSCVVENCDSSTSSSTSSTSNSSDKSDMGNRVDYDDKLFIDLVGVINCLSAVPSLHPMPESVAAPNPLEESLNQKLAIGSQPPIPPLDSQSPSHTEHRSENTRPSQAVASLTIAANNLLKSNIKLLGNLIYRCEITQHMLRTSNSIVTILNHCHTNFNNPLVREYSLMCIRNATENNMENQEFINNIKVKP